MLPRYPKETNDRSEILLTNGVNITFADTTAAASLMVGSDGDKSDNTESDVINCDVS